MARRVRKQVVYVTLDGKIHSTAADAKKHADRLDATMKRTPKSARSTRSGRRKRGPTDILRILKAIDEGALDAKALIKKSGVKSRNVHPNLSNLRKRKLIVGKSGSLKLTTEGRTKLSTGFASTSRT